MSYILAIELKKIVLRNHLAICIVRFYIFYAYFKLRCHDAAITFIYFLARPMQHLESISANFNGLFKKKPQFPFLIYFSYFKCF